MKIMKFFSRAHNPEVDPRAKVFFERVVGMLVGMGITDKGEHAKCARALFQSTLHFYKRIESGMAKGAIVGDEVVQKQTDEMKSILARHGMTDTEKQEEFIVDFFTLLNDLGMNK